MADLDMTSTQTVAYGTTAGAADLRRLRMTARSPAQGVTAGAATVAYKALRARSPAQGVTAATLGASKPMTATSAAGATSSVALSGTSLIVPLRATGTAGVSHARAMAGGGLSVGDVVGRVVTLFGLCDCDGVSDACLQLDLIQALNAALQTIYAQAKRLDYFNRKTATVVFGAAEASKELSTGIQNVLGPVRLSNAPKTPLTQIESRHEFDAALDLYYGGASYAPATPRFYHLRSEAQTADDSVKLTLFIAPAAGGSGQDVLLDYAAEAPRYEWRDVTAGTRLAMPHRYAETILVPLVRDWATSHRYFIRRDLLNQIQQQAQQARLVLGLVEP